MTIIEIIIPAILFAVLIWLTLWYGILIPPKKKFAVLMYHKVSDNNNDTLTISTDDLNLQFTYLKEKGYQSLSFKDLKSLAAEGLPIPRKAVIITFDDAYKSFREKALPLLKKFDFKTTLFVPLAYLGKTNIWDKGKDPIMNAEELKQISIDNHVEIGLHSFLHRNYEDLAISDMEEDLNNCLSTLSFYHIPYVKVLAYPYGGYPKKDPRLKEQMFTLFKSLDLDFALRIGNKINPYPIKQPYEMKRIDIRGTDSFFIFKTKLKKGRARVFV